MTKRLQEALTLAEKLPPESQDRIAELVIEEIRADRAWEERFASSQDELEKLARRAVERDERGESVAKGWNEL